MRRLLLAISTIVALTAPGRARVGKGFKLSGPSDYLVPAGSRPFGRHGVVSGGANRPRRLWVDWDGIGNLDAGAAQNLGRRSSFISREDLLLDGTSVILVGSVITARVNAIRSNSWMGEQGTWLIPFQ